MDKNILDFATLSNLSLIEQTYSDYLNDPASVDLSWKHFFEGIAFAQSLSKTPGASSSDSSIVALINNYRRYGHLLATTNPLEKDPIPHDYQKLLKIESAGFSKEDLSKSFATHGLPSDKSLTLGEILDYLRKVYCRNIGFEFMGYTSLAIESFITERIENESVSAPSHDELTKGFTKLTDTEVFEEFLNKKYTGQKRFSIEGCATLIPLLSQVFDTGSKLGVNTFVIGMAHRGRLSVLANLLNKPYREMFVEFDPDYIPKQEGRSGDVKYHMGYESDVKCEEKDVSLVLCANPSHLESVDPVALGRSRARQDTLEEASKNRVSPILVHGDASIAGQGIVYETMQMVHLKGFTTKGTIHVVVNNQVGFTATVKDTQSMHYTTDLAKAFGAPVFHVNAEDTASVIKVAKLAMEIRQTFAIDVIIEIIGYRKYGHNEGDEPAFTQPVMYRTIREKKPIRALFKEELVASGVVSKSEAEKFEQESLTRCEKGFAEKKLGTNSLKTSSKSGVETIKKPGYINAESMRDIAKKACYIPGGFDLHKKMRRILDDRLRMVQEGRDKLIDWGMAETLAMGSLLALEKVGIRLSGQDSMRGTFAHRHAYFFDQTTNDAYTPLSALSKDQASFQVYNALLSEYAALGFEYGYAIDSSQTLTIWEAQFGDFANSAQVVIDQYIASGYQKWGESAPLLLLLPHGYEGQGPEHSSARIERFLQLASNENMDLIIPSTSRSYFQAIVERGLTKKKRPAVIFTPKALLRFTPSLCLLDELIAFDALPIIEDKLLEKKVDKLIFCSGKVAYDLKEARGEKKIAIVTIEQIYPFPKERVAACIEKALKNNKACQILWVQEEHQNMGCWEFVHAQLKALLSDKKTLLYVGRDKSASTAAGTKALHLKERAQFIKKAME